MIASIRRDKGLSVEYDHFMRVSMGKMGNIFNWKSPYEPLYISFTGYYKDF